MYYSVKYTDAVKKGSAGQAITCFITIRPEYKDDVGLLKHEIVHTTQFWRTFGFHALMYLLFKKYRLASEVEAYKEQLNWPPATNGIKEDYAKIYAGFISEKYSLDISLEDAIMSFQ